MIPRKTSDEYLILAHSCGLEWVGAYPQNTFLKTLWRCASGHQWEARYSDIRSGRRCPFCAKIHQSEIQRITRDDFITLSSDTQIEWRGTKVVKSSQKTLWRCTRGHEWNSTYSEIRAGYGCPACAGNIRKTSADYQALATIHEFEWIGELPPNISSKSLWRCQYGHEWNGTYASIRRGRGCPTCARMHQSDYKRIPQERYHEVAHQHGIEWIGEFPQDSHSATTWKCSNGHEWNASYQNIRTGNGAGCPKCDNRVNGFYLSNPQRELHEIMGGFLNFRVKRYAIDVALDINGVKIGLEYDCAFWHDPIRDAKRDAYLISQGWRMLRVKSGTLLPSREQLDIAIAELVNGASYTEIVLPDWRGG